MEMKLNRETVLMIRPSAATSYRSGVRVDGCSREASDEQACQGTLGIGRAIGWYAFACCSPE
jgi:hypothetical protein